MTAAFVLVVKSECAPVHNVLQDIEHDGENSEDYKTNPRPFLHLRFHRFPLVLSEEGFAGTAECVDTRRITGLQHNKYDCGKCGDSHEDDKNRAEDATEHQHVFGNRSVFPGRQQI